MQTRWRGGACELKRVCVLASVSAHRIPHGFRALARVFVCVFLCMCVSVCESCTKDVIHQKPEGIRRGRGRSKRVPSVWYSEYHRTEISMISYGVPLSEYCLSCVCVDPHWSIKQTYIHTHACVRTFETVSTQSRKQYIWCRSEPFH